MKDETSPRAADHAPGVAQPVLGVRARARQQTVTELLAIARGHLAAEGAASLSLRAVARDAGMVSSAVYRYFPSRDHLLTQLIVDAYNSMGESVELAYEAVAERDPLIRWRTVCFAVRDWALANPHEYALIFGSPVPGYRAPQDTIEPASRVPKLLGAMLVEVRKTTTVSDPKVPVKLRPEIARVASILGMQTDLLGLDLMVRGLMVWTHLFGSISFQLFGHRHNVIDDGNAFFALEVDRLARDVLGLPI